jgi:LEA14-like dessication related protein
MQDTSQVIMEEMVVDVVDTTGNATEYVGVVTTDNPNQFQAYIDMLGAILFGIVIFTFIFSLICNWIIF